MKKRILISALCGLLGLSQQVKAWSSPATIESATIGSAATSVCIGIDGATSDLFVAYSGRDNGNPYRLGVNTYSVATGLAGTARSVGYFGDTGFSCASDANGNFYIPHTRIGNYPLYYVMYSSGAWGSDIELDTTRVSDVDYTAVAVDSSGNLHIAYNEDASSSRALLYATGAPDAAASSWTFMTVELGGSAVNLGSRPAIAIDSSDTVHVAYFDETNGDLKYASKVATATAFTVQSTAVDGSASYTANLDMAIDSEGGVHISYVNGDDVKHAVYADGVWTVEDVDTASSAMQDTSIEVVSPTSVHITYWDNTTNAVKYATNVTGTWVSSDIATTNAYNSDIASGLSGDEGSIYIAYYDDASGTVELVYNTCGDATVDVSEECDDGNNTSDDGCSATCEIEVLCSDGDLDTDEKCDDGNTTDGDGCSATCGIEAGYSCSGEPSVCAPTCGDGILTGSETCDDGNATADDGCSATCAVESGYACSGAPSICMTTCGDSVIAGSETCDDGNTAIGDGCSVGCATETGFTCSGEPSVCATVCGDGVPRGTETCDDGNSVNTDYCLNTCAAAACSDGYVQTVIGETCDDGDSDSTDSCPGNCRTAICGDRYTWSTDGGTEACDDGNVNNGDGCGSNCQVEHAPTANAGADQTVTWSTTSSTAPTIRLTGTATDADTDAVLSYRWVIVRKPAASALTNTSLGSRLTLNATLVPDVRGVYEVRLTVIDEDFYTARDQAVITVR